MAYDRVMDAWILGSGSARSVGSGALFAVTTMTDDGVSRLSIWMAGVEGYWQW
jgi:hypothetical protein